MCICFRVLTFEGYNLTLRLKKNVEKESEKAKSLTLDLQRKEEEASDQREKLADYKKQVQQIQKEVYMIL